MRWDGLRLHGADADAGPEPGAGRPSGTATAPALFERDAVARTFDTPGFRGITFYEVHARSIINRVPEASRMAFKWTINPYRGCSHACSYCFARNTPHLSRHGRRARLQLQDRRQGQCRELAARELARPRWPGEHVAMGTNVDCYQRAEGRYRLMPGIIAALSAAAQPVLDPHQGNADPARHRPARQAAAVTDVGLNVSVGFLDAGLSRSVEPGTPSPERRLAVCSTLGERGLRCGVLMGPMLPYLSDSPAQLEATVRQIAAAGATRVTPIVLHLRPGAREWYLQWLREQHPRARRALPPPVRLAGVRAEGLPAADHGPGP